METITLKKTSNTTRFVATMNAMRHHYKASPSISYPLPTNLLAAAWSEPVPDAAKEATDKFRDNVDIFQNNESNSLTASSENYIDTQDYENFKAQMEANRKQAKADADARIDHYYDAMIQVGIENPGAQNIILKITKEVSDFFNNVLEAIQNFVTDLVRNIVEWFKKVFQQIKDFFDNAFSEVANFFDSIF